MNDHSRKRLGRQRLLFGSEELRAVISVNHKQKDRLPKELNVRGGDLATRFACEPQGVDNKSCHFDFVQLYLAKKPLQPPMCRGHLRRAFDMRRMPVQVHRSSFQHAAYQPDNRFPS